MPEKRSIRVGPFLLEQPIGTGGMGTVWSAIHGPSGASVAIKFVLPTRASNIERFREAFQREVESVARLDHPGIVSVFEYGTVDPSAAEQLPGVTAGSPYLVMELASHGSLAQGATWLPVGAPLWPTLYEGLLQILDALAHAHARGVIHRDLKPGNLLVVEDDEKRHIVVTDFGIAHALDTELDLQRNGVSGTPGYMAPEQLSGEWREQGPWTDMYALGCVAWELATGRLPYESASLVELIRAHLHAPIPSLPTDSPCPPEFDDWLGHMLAKSPFERFTCAADAAWALRAIGADAIDALAELTTYDDIETEPGPDRITTTYQPTLTVEGWMPEPVSVSSAVVEHPTPPVAPAWDGPLSPVRPSRVDRIMGAGLGLFGLREAPFVDRSPQRDALWRHLVRVAQDNRPAAVVLLGPAGCGKSRLARWLRERAHELGAAQHMLLRHDGRPQHLGRLIQNTCRLHNLAPADAFERMARHLRYIAPTDDFSVDIDRFVVSLLTLAEPAVDVPDVAPISFSGAHERHTVIARYLRWRSRQRPVIVDIDDAHLSPESFDFVAHCLAEKTLPTLFVLTVRRDLLEEAPAARAALDDLLRRDAAHVIDLGPLEDADLIQMVDELIGLEPALLETVAARTNGNPLFAVQMLGALIKRDVLEPSAAGFRLRPGETAGLPVDVTSAWLDRVGQLASELDGDRDELLRLLSIGAAHSGPIGAQTWSELARELGWELAPAMLDALPRHGLALRSEHGWVWSHLSLRDTLTEQAQRLGVWAPVHLVLANRLASATGAADLELRGHHLAEAGRAAEAIEPLRIAGQTWINASDYLAAARTRARVQTLLENLGAEPDDPRRHAILDDQALGSVIAEDYEQADRAFEQLEAARRRGRLAPQLEAELYRVRGIAHVYRLRPDLGLEDLRRALQKNDPTTDPKQTIQIHAGLGSALKVSGRLDEAVEHYELAYRGAANKQVCKPTDQAIYAQGYADALRRTGAHQRAVELLTEAIAVFQAYGMRKAMAQALNVMGEVGRTQGNLVDAERSYRQAAAINGEIGISTFIPEINIGFVLLERHRFPKAAAHFTALLQRAAANYHHELYIRIGLLVCAAGAGHVEQIESLSLRIKQLLHKQPVYDHDIARMFELAGIYVAKTSPAHAQRCWTWAVEQYQRLGETDAVDRVRRATQDLGLDGLAPAG